MEEGYWAKCQYYAAGNCPDELMILLDRAYLISHLLDSSEIEAAKKVCRDCKKQERRNSYRINKPLAVVLSNQQPNTRVEGSVINASASGALVKLEKCINFANSQVVELVFTSSDNNNSGQASTTVTRESGVIKRCLKKRSQVAIMFLTSADQD
jgi:hypothetical protein